MISFLKSFGEVTDSSKSKETKGYSPGIFFRGPKKMARKVIHLNANEKIN